MVELPRQNRKAGATLSAMNKITQDMRYKQAVIEFSLKHGVTAAAIHYKTTRQNIYRWRKKYDGSVRSLADRQVLSVSRRLWENIRTFWLIFRLKQAVYRISIIFS